MIRSTTIGLSAASVLALAQACDRGAPARPVETAQPSAQVQPDPVPKPPAPQAQAKPTDAPTPANKKMPRGAITWLDLGKLEHVGPRATPVFARDGRAIALYASSTALEAPASFDDTIRIHDLKTKAILHRIRLPKGTHPSCFAFDPTGTLVAYSLLFDYSKEEDPGPENAAVVVYDLKSQKPIWRLLGHPTEVQALAFSHDGKTLASGDEDTRFILWDLATGQKRKTFQDEAGEIQLCLFRFSPDDRYLAVGGDHCESTLWDLSTGKPVKTFGEPACLTFGITYSPDGKRLISSNQSNLVIICDAQTGKKLGQMMHTSAIGDVSFSPDGHHLAAGGGTHYGQVVIWSGNGQEKRSRHRGHTETVLGVQFWPDSQHVASASFNEVIVWNLAEAQKPQPNRGAPPAITPAP